MAIVKFTYQGEEVSFRADLAFFRDLEAPQNHFSFAKIAELVEKVAANKADPADVPLSHISLVVAHCLRHAGVRVRDEMALHWDIAASKVDWGPLMGQLILAYYVPPPPAVVKKSSPVGAKTKRPRRSRQSEPNSPTDLK